MYISHQECKFLANGKCIERIALFCFVLFVFIMKRRATPISSFLLNECLQTSEASIANSFIFHNNFLYSLLIASTQTHHLNPNLFKSPLCIHTHICMYVGKELCMHISRRWPYNPFQTRC